MIRKMTADELVAAHANEGVIALVDSNEHRFEVEGENAYSTSGSSRGGFAGSAVH